MYNKFWDFDVDYNEHNELRVIFFSFYLYCNRQHIQLN